MMKGIDEIIRLMYKKQSELEVFILALFLWNLVLTLVIIIYYVRELRGS